jgi:hypothetical protein
MKSLLMIAIALLVLPGAAPAERPRDDVIGVYLDEMGHNDCTEDADGPLTTYLVLSGLTSTGVIGWEVKLSFTGGGLCTAEVPRGLAIDVGTREDEHIVGLASPLLAEAGAVVVMQMELFVTDPLDPLLAHAGPVYFHVGPEELPYYLDAADPELAKPLVPSSGDIAEPVFQANVKCPGPVGTVAATWGAIKALYR